VRASASIPPDYRSLPREELVQLVGRLVEQIRIMKAPEKWARRCAASVCFGRARRWHIGRSPNRRCRPLPGPRALDANATERLEAGRSTLGRRLVAPL
jgi:hypothetical protein